MTSSLRQGEIRCLPSGMALGKSFETLQPEISLPFPLGQVLGHGMDVSLQFGGDPLFENPDAPRQTHQLFGQAPKLPFKTC